MMTMAEPTIGVTLDNEPAGGYSNLPWYALRENYCAPISAAGGLPIALPHDADRAESYLDLIDGLVVTGGDFDVDPLLFGVGTVHPAVKTKDLRTAFELALTKGALARDMPVFGICGGQQLLHVALGGTLHQHIPDAVPDALAHEQPNPRTEPGHAVAIKAGTRLHDIVGLDELQVNSAHHQAADQAPAPITVNAVAPDGVTEGIEVSERGFCIGVQ
jgi:putative glutamine amidotransferase